MSSPGDAISDEPLNRDRHTLIRSRMVCSSIQDRRLRVLGNLRISSRLKRFSLKFQREAGFFSIIVEGVRAEREFGWLTGFRSRFRCESGSAVRDSHDSNRVPALSKKGTYEYKGIVPVDSTACMYRDGSPELSR